MKKILLAACLFVGLSSFGLEQQPNLNKKLEFKLDVTSWNYPGLSVQDKFGVNYNITAGEVDNDVWEFGGTYPFDTWGTAPIMYLSSSSTADTNMPIKITGLDIDGYEVFQTITNDGQNVSTLTTPLWWVYRLENESDEGGDTTGIIYCHTNATATVGVPPDASIRAIINDGNNQTLMAIYTIPKGKVGFLWRGELGVALDGNAAALAEYALVHYESRRLGKVFKVKKSLTLMVGGGSALYQDERSFPDIIPALTDIRIRSKECTQDMGIWAAFDILLVEESQVNPTFLQAIGQP